MPQTLPPPSPLTPATQHLFRYVQSVYRLGLCSPDPYYEFQRLISHTSGVQSTLQPPTTLTLLHQYVINVEFDFQQLIIGHFWSQVLKLGPKDTLTTTDEQNGHCPGFGQVLCQYWCFRQRFCQQWPTGSSLCRRSTSSQNMCLPLQLQHSGISKWCMSVSAIAFTGFMW